MKNYLRALSHSFLMKNIDDLKQYCKRCSGMIPYYNLAKCNANICCNCHKEWSSFSWWYQIHSKNLHFNVRVSIQLKYFIPFRYFFSINETIVVFFKTRFSIFFSVLLENHTIYFNFCWSRHLLWHIFF